MQERLRKFAHLLEAGSFTKAAADLHISQPALSAAMAKLERELKTNLLVRGVRPLSPTPAGKLAYQTAKDLSVQADNLKLRLAELSHEQIHIKIGMIDSIADTLFAEGAGLELAKEAEISLVVNNSRYLVDATERGEVDVAFIARQQRPLPSVLESKPIAAEPLVVVARSGETIPKGSALPNFIAYDQPSNTFRLVNEALQGYGVTPQTSFYSTSPDVTLRLVLQNKGIAALPYLLVRDHLKNGDLQLLGQAKAWLIRREIVVLKRRDKQLPQALKHLTSQTASILADLLQEVERWQKAD